MDQWNTLTDDATLEKVIAALKASGIEAEVVESAQEAKKRVLALIPKGSEVMTMTSQTLEATGISEGLNTSADFVSVREKLNAANQKDPNRQMKQLGAAPQYCVGSVHAITEDGHCLIASATGSQLPAYVYGSDKVIWVAGTQKIVKNTEEGLKRVYEYVLPLESERAKVAYGVPGSAVNKLLIFNKEIAPGRVRLILVKEKLGF